ncbi:MAG: hypothetical protein ABIZ34_10190, partial [Candidatus Limnocylindrales bacterium]
SATIAARHTDAEALVNEAIAEAAATGDPTASGAAQALLGEILIDAAKPVEAVASLESALALFAEDGPGAVRAEMLANLSRAFMRGRRPAEAIGPADLALDLAEHLGLGRILAETLNNKGSSLVYLGRLREGRALLRAAVDVAREGGHVAAEIRALLNLGATAEDARESRAANQAAAELAMRVGNRNLTNWASTAVQYSNYLAGEDWDQMLAGLTSPVDDGQGRVEPPLDEVRRLALVAYLLAARGESTDAILARLEVLEPQITDSYGESAVRFLRHERALLAGDLALSADEAVRAAEVDLSLAGIYLSRGLRPALWARDLERARDIAERLDRDPSTAIPATNGRITAWAGIAALEGRTDEAVDGFLDAISRTRAVGNDVIAAMVALDMVDLLGADHPATREPAAEARIVFERIGAKPYLERLDMVIARAPDRTSREVSSLPTAPSTESR